LTPQELDTKYVESLEEALRLGVDPDVHLVVQSVLTHALDRNGPVFQSEKERSRHSQIVAQTQFIARATQVLTAQLQAMPVARLLDVRRDFEHEQSVVHAVVRTPATITPAYVKRMQDALQDAASVPVHLIVRSVPIRVADTEGYLYETPTTSVPLTGEALALQQQLETLVTSHLKAIAGASLLELPVVQQHDWLHLIAVVRTPQAITPEQVQPIEADLRHRLSPHIELIVRSVVGTDATATGYLTGIDSAQLLPQPPGVSNVQ
jgi:hypothetical protein